MQLKADRSCWPKVVVCVLILFSLREIIGAGLEKKCNCSDGIRKSTDAEKGGCEYDGFSEEAHFGSNIFGGIERVGEPSTREWSKRDLSAAHAGEQQPCAWGLMVGR